MENVCRDCGRRFLSDLRFCPHCGGDAKPPRTKDWHYRPDGMVAHWEPTHDDVIQVYKQNAWVLLCCGILLIPLWLEGISQLDWHIQQGDYLDIDMLFFYFSTTLLVMIGAAMSSAFSAKRPTLQVMVPGLVVVHTTFWSSTAMFILLAVYLLVVILWAVGGGRSSRMNPSYLPVATVLGILSLLMTYIWLLYIP